MKNKKYAFGYFLIGISDILDGVLSLLYSILVLIWPSRYVNEQGQRKRWGIAFDLTTRLHIYASSIFYG